MSQLWDGNTVASFTKPTASVTKTPVFKTSCGGSSIKNSRRGKVSVLPMFRPFSHQETDQRSWLGFDFKWRILDHIHYWNSVNYYWNKYDREKISMW